MGGNTQPNTALFDQFGLLKYDSFWTCTEEYPNPDVDPDDDATAFAPGSPLALNETHREAEWYVDPSAPNVDGGSYTLARYTVLWLGGTPGILSMEGCVFVSSTQIPNYFSFDITIYPPGVPSIIYGILGLAVFVRFLEPITSGKAFGLVEDPTTANGRTILSAGLTLALLVLPIIIINAQEAIRAVPGSLRQASYGLGATKWQTVWNHVLPNAISGILTGTILAISRAFGETAPLVVVGASTFITVDPTGIFSKFTTLPMQIYQWTARPQDTFRNIAAAAIIVLLIILLSMNAIAIYLRNRYSRRY